MSHRTWIASGLGLLLAASAGAQDLAGGFTAPVFSKPSTGLTEIFAFWPPAIADFDEDGLPDIAAQSHPYSELALAFAQGAEGLGPKVIVPSGVTHVANVRTADIDGDTHADLLVVANFPEISWLRGHGDGSFDAPLPAGPGPGYVTLLLADADGDGRADLIGAPPGGQLTLWKGDGAGAFGPPSNLGDTDAPSDLLLQDLDDDGVLDLALLDFGRVQVRQGLGGGAFGAPQAWSNVAQNGLEAADLDLDGHVDLVHGSPSNVATVLHGLGGLQFAGPQLVTMSGGAWDLTIGDLDRDGFADLLGTISNGQPTLVTRRMGPAGPVGLSFAEITDTQHVSDGVRTDDFDGDGLLDAVVPDALSGQYRVALSALGPFIGFGHELPAPEGTPGLAVFGVPQAGNILSVAVGGPSQPSMGLLFIGLEAANIPFKGTLFVPDVLTSVGIGVVGQAYFSSFWPAAVPPGTTLYLQAWFKTPSGLGASNAWMILSE